MSNKTKTKEIKKNGILVYQLHPKYKDEVLARFPTKNITKVISCKEGLQIYFNRYSLVRECLLMHTIEVDGRSYTISPMVTNLTVRNIQSFASKSVILNVMKSYGCVIELHQVTKVTENRNCITYSPSEDYRIILDVPEILADFKLSPVQLPTSPNHRFDVLFFCRLCRQDRHMQYQCSNSNKTIQTKSTTLNDAQGFRRLSYESNNSNTTTNKDSGVQYPISTVTNRRISRSFSDNAVNIKQEKTNYSNDSFKFDTCESPSKKVLVPEYRFLKLKRHQSRYVPYEYLDTGSECRQNNNLITIKCDSTSDSKKVGEDSGKSAQSSPFSHLPASTSRHITRSGRTSNEVDKRMKKKRNTKHASVTVSQSMVKKWYKNLPSFLPGIVAPHTDLPLALQRVRTALETDDPSKISLEVEAELRNIVDWNKSRKEKHLTWKEEKFLLLLTKFLKIVSRKSKKIKKISGKSDQKTDIDIQTNLESPKNGSGRRTHITLSPGIKQAIYEASGILEPELLCNFISQVRGRKKLIEIASIFTEDILALAEQLSTVRNVYYLQVVKRGPEEDRDISYIKRLRKRLLKQEQDSHSKNIIGDMNDVCNSHSATNAVQDTLDKDIYMRQTSHDINSTLPSNSHSTESNLHCSVETDIFMRQSSRESNILPFNNNSSTRTNNSTQLFTVKSEVMDINDYG